MIILNLGCGSKTSSYTSVINIDWSILLKIRSNPFLRILAPILLNNDRLARFNELPDNLLVHNLSKGIPFPNNSVDAVYHSHILEHLDRDAVPIFIREIARVLKPGGILRIVVPDFERYCRSYLDHIIKCEKIGNDEIQKHDFYLEPLLSMSVRREAFGTSQQKPLRRFIENLLLGDARKRGETHQWMYDRFNLQALLENAGYSQVKVQSYASSMIEEWQVFELDVDKDGNEYKPESLYIEAILRK